MSIGCTTILEMPHDTVYSIDEIVEWCVIEHGKQGQQWNYEQTDPVKWTFEFANTRDMVRFGLTWNKLTLKSRPRQWY